MLRFKWVFIWILIGCLLTGLASYAVGSVLVAFALSYLVINWWRNRHARTFDR